MLGTEVTFGKETVPSEATPGSKVTPGSESTPGRQSTLCIEIMPGSESTHAQTARLEAEQQGPACCGGVPVPFCRLQHSQGRKKEMGAVKS